MQTLLALAPYASLVVSLISGTVALLLWSARKEFATNGALAAVGRRADLAHHRLDLLTKDVQALPTHETVHAMREDIGQLKEEQARITTTVQGIDRTVTRIDDFLRAHK